MYVPGADSGATGEEEAIQSVVVVVTSAASLVVLVLVTAICGMCYCFGGSNPDYDDDYATTHVYQTTEQDQKRPILHRASSMGERNPKKILRGTSSPVFNHQSSISPSDEKSATLPSDLSKRFENASKSSSKKTVMFRAMSLDPASIPFERPTPKVGVEHIQPDPGRIGQSQHNQSTSNGQAETMAFGQGVEDDSLMVGDNLGKVQFSLMYDFPDQTLVLRIVKANHLPAKDFSGTSDPFVKIMLLPDKKVKMETKVKRKNLNPIWNESFHFEGYPYAKIQERVLHLQVLDYDRFSRNDPIGEVNLPLAEVDLTHEKVYWRVLTPSKKSSGKLGSVLISLCYAPTAGRITITVLKCQNLAAKDITGKSDPYVKIWHMFKEKRIEKKKTIVKYHTLNPVYNESFVFNIPLDRIRETSFVVSVIDKDRLSKNDMIGGILLGARASPPEMSHWNEMMSKPRTNIAKWHVLKGMN